jgi:hypothetical protein
MKRSGLLVLVVALGLNPSCAGGVRAQGLGVVKEQTGRYVAPAGACAIVVTHEEGDRLDLHVERHEGLVLRDVNGWAWVAPDRLVVTVSPIYGVPGVYLYRCGGDSFVTLVRARHRTATSPDGTDYFEMASVTTGKRGEVRFYYLDDVDLMPEQGDFRDSAHMYRVSLNGSGFRKVR